MSEPELNEFLKWAELKITGNREIGASVNSLIP
jgi:hypothetical protein